MVYMFADLPMQVTALPTLIMYRDGTEVCKITGAVTEKEIRNMIKML